MSVHESDEQQGMGDRRRCPGGVDGSGSSSVGPDEKIIGGMVYKRRLIWTGELLDRFVAAVNELGGADKATPSKIQELMDVPGLTREKIGSRLQKHRLFLEKTSGKKRRSSQASISDSERVNGIARGNGQVLSFKAPKLCLPEVPMGLQGMSMPEFVSNSHGRNFEFQYNGNQSETSSSLDEEIEKFFAIDTETLDLAYEPLIQGHQRTQEEEQQWPGLSPSPFGQGMSNDFRGFGPRNGHHWF
ncbi:hypothetical protein MLD38_035726 [Melastoma candidum]|uniref:Uncharacterized protein n=1 Tax=Melastoma candidum TaxID=119954 RepID=A0ACB9LHQ3_9MYRT|nr:hypothetical protein MLD38_035726 [Melastoma candidum]